MVKALIISCLFRSVLDVLPPIVHKVSPSQLRDILPETSGSLISFCIADSILYVIACAHAG